MHSLANFRTDLGPSRWLYLNRKHINPAKKIFFFSLLDNASALSSLGALAASKLSAVVGMLRRKALILLMLLVRFAEWSITLVAGHT